MASLIESTLVLHNWFIDFKLDSDPLDHPLEYEDWMHIGGDLVYEFERNIVGGDKAVTTRNSLKDYLYNYVRE